MNEYKRRFLLFVKAIEIQNPEKFINENDEIIKGVGTEIKHSIRNALMEIEIINRRFNEKESQSK